MPKTDRPTSPPLGWRRLAPVAAAATAAAMLYGLAVRPQLALIDHIAFRDTAARMRAGSDYYDAYLDAFEDGFGTIIGESRGVRLPSTFLLWRVVPDELLYVLYIAVVVVLTGTLLAAAAPRHRYAALAASVYLLVAGRSPLQPHVDAWLMSELWAVPALAGAVLAWTRGRDWVCVGLVVLAVATREIAAVALVTGAVLAISERRSVRPWLVGGALATGLVAAHFLTTADRLRGSAGGVTPVGGTGDPPRTVVEMMAWNLPAPAWLFALTAAAGAVLALRRFPELRMAGFTLPVPLLGIVVERSYWGMLAIPFAWWLTAIAATEAARDHRATRRFRSLAEGET